jgi:hypothetical protein
MVNSLLTEPVAQDIVNPDAAAWSKVNQDLQPKQAWS